MGKNASAIPAASGAYQRKETPSPVVPRPEPTMEGDIRVKWRPNVNYCVNGTGWAHGTYLEALNPESKVRSICFTCRVWRREPLLGLLPRHEAGWRARYNPDGTLRQDADVEERMKAVEEIRESPICPTCGGEKVWVDARFEPPSQQKPLKEWKKRYDEWMKLKGSAVLLSAVVRAF